jgi:hypothetical protein
MANLDMDVYIASTGVQMTIALESEDQYQRVKKFLIGMNANSGSIDAPRPEKPEFFYLQNQQQFDVLCDFLRSLKEKRN